MPSDLFLKSMNTVHRLLLKVSGGRVGGQFGGMPVLELTTIGRRSGTPRSVMLTSPLRDGDAYVVVASRGGDDQHPAWFLNLRNKPEVRVTVHGGAPTAMIAEIASPEDRARMWPVVVKQFGQYGGYQKRTDREIPLVLLRPTS
jgi:deazaflavin-dependent oxidoreductase (nitroreductase family)